MILTYKYRLLPTKRQHAALADILESQRQLYNAALQERIDAWSKSRLSISFFDQCRSLTICRRDIPEMEAISRIIQEPTLRKLDFAFGAFFKRVKSGKKAGFPRFRGRDRWKSFSLRSSTGLSVLGRSLSFKALPGSLRFHEHRALPRMNVITAAVISRDFKGWSVSFSVDIKTECHKSTDAIGIDVGITTLAALSTGEMIPNIRAAKRAEKKMRRHQRALSRCRRTSKRRKKIKIHLARLHRHVVNARSTYLHQISARLTRQHATLIVEKLNVNGLLKTKLARSINDAAWSNFKFMLAYKAERAGGELIEVDPKFTSQDCSGCGRRVAKTLSEREHSCSTCGLVLDRDVNAAINILHKAKLGLEAGNVAQWGERRLRNIGGQI